MRPISLALFLLVALPALAATPEELASWDALYAQRLDAALKIEPMFERGGPLLAKGRYYFELPWPKRDLKKSATHFQKALARHPESLRGWLYLAETLLADGEEKKAQEAIMQVTQGTVAYDPAEGQRVQGLSNKVQADIEEELK